MAELGLWPKSYVFEEEEEQHDYLGCHGGFLLYISQLTILFVFPCIVIEKVNVQIESAIHVLYRRMFTETGSTKKEIRELLQYMGDRCLTWKAWRMIPLDKNLPLGVFKFLVTYIIVLIQLTHIYD
ncbi:hypothetical protein NE865_03547 [Phthorimaea operculella]|nr:hypothetical protein NE865_03547 [Phthorimaea operculella]